MVIIPPSNNPSSHPLQIFECITCGYTYTNRTSGLTIKNHYANCSGYPQVIKQLPNVQYCQYCGQDVTGYSLGHTCAQGQSSNVQGARTAQGFYHNFLQQGFFALQHMKGVYGTNGPSSSSSVDEDDESFTKLKAQMISTKLIPIDEFDDLILILLPFLGQEVIDFLWWEFESNWVPPSYSWAGMQRSVSHQPFFFFFLALRSRPRT